MKYFIIFVLLFSCDFYNFKEEVPEVVDGPINTEEPGEPEIVVCFPDSAPFKPWEWDGDR